MRTWERHELVWLSARGWQEHALQQAVDATTAACLQHWFVQRLPLVVGRQSVGDEQLALGLAAPLAWDKRKIALKVPPACVLYHDRFPSAAEVASVLAPKHRAQWLAWSAELAEAGANPRVHGSYGWQRTTGLAYVTARSDIDLHLTVTDADAADRVATMLEGFAWRGPRVDGELVFPAGEAVAWREWLQWRRGAVDRILVKRRHGVALEQGLAWLADRSPVAA